LGTHATQTRHHASAAHSAAGSPRQEVAGTMDEREPATLRALVDVCATYMSAPDLQSVRAAYTTAARAHQGTLRVSGEPFIEHPLAVARILSSVAMDAVGIAAALLHDTVEDTSQTLDEIEGQFGPVISSVVDGVTKFDLVQLDADGVGAHPTPDQRKRQQKETVQKLLVAMMRDPRVVVLKLADRLHNLRTLASMSPAQRAAKARETLEIYAPLADRIGLQVFKSELEDLAFSYLQPDQFERVSRRLQQEAAARNAWAHRVSMQVQRNLLEEGIPAAVNWRLKRPYRAYVETQASGMSEADLHDLIAFRVLVNTELECYRAMGVIHSQWHHLDARIRDYIATPKVNGYRSLHTAVFAFDGRKAQFHIRTHDMHRRVQHGVATHWLERASRGEPVDTALGLALDDLPAWVAQLDDWHRELRLSADAFVDALKSDVFDDQVFVFTPKGEIIDLAAGSTPLDFAYRIHTAVGDHCAGARVQTLGPYGIPVIRDVRADYHLKTGDVVTIVTDPSVRPRPEWLGIVRTRNAREKLARALRTQADDEGRTASADGAEPSAESEPDVSAPLLHPSGKPARVQLARCCYPCPDDQIVGLPGPNRRVTIHRACCRTLGAALARRSQRARADEAMPLDWVTLLPTDYRMAIAVHGQDHAGLMHELAACLKAQNIDLARSFAKAIQDRNKAVVTLVCVFTPAMRPASLFRQLRTLPGVTRVERDTRLGCAAPDSGA
jgi:RelA/SpoT family (p)ppGpp synthetase